MQQQQQLVQRCLQIARTDVLQMTLAEDPWENDQTIALLLSWLEQDAMRVDPQFFKIYPEHSWPYQEGRIRFVFKPFGRYRSARINHHKHHGPPIGLLIEQIQGGIDEIRGKHPIRMMAAWRIQRAWRRAISNPDYLICQRRLLREFDDLPEEAASRV
jgi:hypothetical protein